jgi:hypothetical protein
MLMRLAPVEDMKRIRKKAKYCIFKKVFSTVFLIYSTVYVHCAMCSNHRQLLTYEKNGLESAFGTKKKHILKNNQGLKMFPRALKFIPRIGGWIFFSSQNRSCRVSKNMK